ncbi:MAG: hypothetical protein HQL51_10285 [Magnetococcales bacterium]|nr:hypothetical protein [Magnetococcales bacterium]
MATDMRLSQRSKLSLCQFLEIFTFEKMRTLLMKHGMEANNLEWNNLSERLANVIPKSIPPASDAHNKSLIEKITRESILAASDEQIAALLDELFRTKRAIRNNISPKNRYDTSWDDLVGCLELDGYVEVQDEDGIRKKIVPLDPTIEGQEPLEDDLTRVLKVSGLPNEDDILRCLENSTSAFRSTQNPDFNASLINARVALESIARDIAGLDADTGAYNPDKWGSILSALKAKGSISEDQEKGLAGVYRFLSPGSHRPQAMTEREYVRLARHLAVSMAFFLLKAREGGSNLRPLSESRTKM